MLSTSFVIIFHPLRIDNLNQTLRFLSKREVYLEELILVCQTECKKIYSPFNKTKQINMNLDSYWKSKMTNVGVSEASNEIIILLDSDRILPHNYFKNIISSIKKKQVVSSTHLIKLKRKFLDEDIESKKITFEIDVKTKENLGRTKNLFAGNTVMFRSDYFNLGGYDETYKGYGYADTDMCKKVMESDLEVIWSPEEEIHLFHDSIVSWESQFLNYDQLKIQTAINGFKYYKKWKLKLESTFKDLIIKIEENINSFPKSLQIDYINAKYEFFNTYIKNK